MSEGANPMLAASITKVTVNIGVGEGGQRLQLAEQVLEILTGTVSYTHLTLPTKA